MATYRLEFGHLGESRPVPDLTVDTGDIDLLSRTVVEYARPHITPVLTEMGRPELADAMFRMNGDRTMGEFLHLDLAGGKGVAFLGVRITTTAKRVQRTRPRVKGQPGMPPGALYVGRGTRFGNPYRIEVDRDGQARVYRRDGSDVVYAAQGVTEQRAYEVATSRYRTWLEQQPGLLDEAQRVLRGRDLACWCALPDEGQPDNCHAVVLLELAANAPKENATS